MSEAIDIFEYLPITLRDQTQQEYISFLWDVFSDNYQNGKYHFAFLAYHMLFMCYVYFEVWQIKEILSVDFKKTLIFLSKEMEKELLNGSTPFTFSQVNERSVFKFFRLIGMSDTEIGRCTKIVDDRNDLAHSNGNIFYRTQDDIDTKIGEILCCMDVIQNHSKNLVESCLEKFILGSLNPDEREFFDENDQIKEILIHDNYFSMKDINIAKGYDITRLGDLAKNQQVVQLMNSLSILYPEEELV